MDKLTYLIGNLKFFLIYLVFSYSLTVLNAQVYNFSNYSLQDGLPHSRIDDIAQDNKGYLWIAHQLGVSKFDGFSFTNFNVKDGLAENKTYALQIFKHDFLIAGHDRGSISIFNDGQIDFAVVDSAAGIIFDFYVHHDGSLWIATEKKGAFKFNSTQGLLSQIRLKKFQNFNENNGLSRTVTSFSKLGRDFLVVTDLGIKRFNHQTGLFEFEQLDGLPFDGYTSIAIDSSANIWIGTMKNGVYVKQLGEQSFTPFNYDEQRIPLNLIVSRIFIARNGEVYIGSWGGGLMIVEKNGNIKYINEDNGIAENKVRCIFEDREGNIWIGSQQNGISCYKSSEFFVLLKGKENKNNQVNCLLKSKSGIVYCGTNNGLFAISKQHDYRSAKLNLFDAYEIFEITSMAEDQKGNLWIATRGFGVLIYNPAAKATISLSAVIPFTEKYINKIYNDRKNNIWIGSISGISFVNFNEKIIRTYNQKDGLTGINVIEIFETQNSELLVVPENHPINVFKQQRFEQLMVEGESAIQGIVHIAQGADVVWLATEGDGLYSLSDGKIQKADFSNNLISNYINSVLEESKHNLWLGTNKGLVHYNIQNNTQRIFDKSGKNSRIETKTGATLQTEQGALWFGTINGLLKFDAERKAINTTPVNLDLTSIQIHFKDTVLNPSARLHYKDNHITFNFNGICFKDPTKVRYKYRLIGFDNDWQLPTSNNFITYSNLNPAYYVFEITACNNDGVWNEQTISFPFSIAPPYYMTWWFFLISAIFILVSIIIYIKFRERQLMKDKKKLETIVNERTKEIIKQKEEIEQQRDEIGLNSNLIKQKNLAITDSIQYAKRIQLASLPNQELMLNELGDSFMFYRPKDIVSGDFYAFSKIGNNAIIATADCTGHGVPGAFMSMIGTNLFNQIVKENAIHKPSEILNHLNKGIENALKQGQTDNHDGMDVAVCYIDFENRMVDFSGANRPCWILKSAPLNSASIQTLANDTCEIYENRLLVIKPDKIPIGGIERGQEGVSFTNHKLKLEPNDLLLIFTDGYVDQFGGANNKKMLSRRFKELLIDIADQATHAQAAAIEQYFDFWRGEQEQVDDILIIGVKF